MGNDIDDIFFPVADRGDENVHVMEYVMDDDDGGNKLAYSLAEEHAFGRGIKVSMALLQHLLGSFNLPIKVAVDTKDESGVASRQVVWLKEKSPTVGVFYIHEPLLSKIRSFSHEARHWSPSEDRGSDGIPCLALELGVRERRG
jgi:hypothetical protein